MTTCSARSTGPSCSTMSARAMADGHSSGSRVERDAAGRPVRDERGRVQASLAGGAGGQGSHVLSALATADALAVIPEAR